MFQGKAIWAIIQTGGPTMYVLLCCSVLSIAVLLERVFYYYRRSMTRRSDFMQTILRELSKGHENKAFDICKRTDTPFAKVALAGLNLIGHNEKTVLQAMEREITIETIKLERFTGIVATIGSTAVYIGLLGTVLGIMHAFRDIALDKAGGVGVVIAGISEALVCTAAGLLVAIPAVVSYNYFTRKIDNFVVDMELCASELMDVLGAKDEK